jgi:hypothetical protein
MTRHVIFPFFFAVWKAEIDARNAVVPCICFHGKYLAWIERAIPIMEADADRESYASAARVPGIAIAKRARDKRLVHAKWQV